MSAVIERLAERQDRFIDLMVQWQKPFIAGLRRTATLVESQTARLEALPGISGLRRLGDLPGAERLSNLSLPSPEEVVRNQFAFAERLLETNKRFALGLASLGGVTPEAPSGTTAAAAAPERGASARRQPAKGAKSGASA